MEHVENNKDNCPKPEGPSKFNDALKAYLEAREALIKKYQAKLPKWTV